MLSLHFLARYFQSEKHHIINRQIRDLFICRNLAGIRQNKSLFHMIIIIFHKVIQRAVNGVILAGLHLNGNGGEAVIIINQIINLAFAAVMVLGQVEAM